MADQQFIKTPDTGHWYQLLPDGRIEARYEANLRTARQEKLYPSVTEVEGSTRANPTLLRWLKNQTISAAVKTPRIAGESDEAYGQRLVEASDRVSKEAREFGSALHQAIADYPQIPLDEKVRPFYDSFAPWWESEFGETLATEQNVADSALGIAGRLDRVAIHKKFGACVVDFKSQNVRKKPSFYPSWIRQLSVYRSCWAQRNGLTDSPQCLSIIIDSNTPKEPSTQLWTHEETEQGYREFLCQLYLWCAERDYWPGTRGKWAPSFSHEALPQTHASG